MTTLNLVGVGQDVKYYGYKLFLVLIEICGYKQQTSDSQSLKLPLLSLQVEWTESGCTGCGPASESDHERWQWKVDCWLLHPNDGGFCFS